MKTDLARFKDLLVELRYAGYAWDELQEAFDEIREWDAEMLAEERLVREELERGAPE